MATVDLTSKVVTWSEDAYRVSPYWDQRPGGHRKSDPNLDYKYRQFSPKRKASVPSDWIHPAEIRVSGPQAMPTWVEEQKFNMPSVPQFSGTVVPAKERNGFICCLEHDDNTKRRTILEKVRIDATGYFESKGAYPVRPNGEYVLFVEGDDTHESNDFRLNSPAENQWQYGKQPNLAAIHQPYNSAENLRELLAHDQFTGSQGASLNGRAPDTVSPGNWIASSVNIGAHADGGGNFVAYTLGSGATAVIDAGTPDVLMHMDFVPGDSALVDSGAGFILRWVNSLNFLLVTLSNITTTPLLIFHEYIGGLPVGVNTRILPHMNPLNVDQYYQWKLLAKGDVIWYQFSDGTKVWSDRVIRQTTHLNNTMHGFLINAGQYVDNFKIWTV